MQIGRVVAQPLAVVQDDVRVRRADECGVAAIVEIGVVEMRLRRSGGAVDGDRAAIRREAGRAGEVDGLRLRALGEDAPASGDSERDGAVHIDRGAGLDHERAGGRDGDIAGELVGAARGGPCRRARTERAGHAGDAGVVIPHVDKALLKLDAVAVEALDVQPVDAGRERDARRRPVADARGEARCIRDLPGRVSGGDAVHFHRCRARAVRLADELAGRRGRERVAVRHRERSPGGRLRGDAGNRERHQPRDVGRAARVEILHRLDARRVPHAREHLVGERVELHRGKRPVEQPLHFLEIHQRILRVDHQREDRRRGQRPRLHLAHAEDAVAIHRAGRRRAGDPVEERVEIVAHELRARVRDAEVEVVVVAVAGRDVRLAVVREQADREEPHPLLHVDRRVDLRHVIAGIRHRITGGGLALGEHLGEVDEVAPLVLAHVRVLEIVHAIRRRAGSRRRLPGALVAQIAAADGIAAEDAVDAPRAVRREVVVGEVRVLDFVAHVEAERRVAGNGRVGPVLTHLHRARLRHGGAGLAEE